MNLCRYAILAPHSIPAGFMDGRKVSQSLIAALELEENEFRIGNSKVRNNKELNLETLTVFIVTRYSRCSSGRAF